MAEAPGQMRKRAANGGSGRRNRGLASRSGTRQRTVDESGKALVVEATDAEDRSQIDRRQDAVEDVGDPGSVLAAVASAIEHRLDLGDAMLQRAVAAGSCIRAH